MTTATTFTTTDAMTNPEPAIKLPRKRRYLGHKTADREPVITSGEVDGEPVLFIEIFGRRGGPSFCIDTDQWPAISSRHGSQWSRVMTASNGYVASGRRLASRQAPHGGIVPVVLLARILIGAARRQHVRYVNGNSLDLRLSNLILVANHVRRPKPALPA